MDEEINRDNKPVRVVNVFKDKLTIVPTKNKDI